MGRCITKRVNIKAPFAVRTVTPPICGNINDILMTSGDILKCLCKRAKVEEILPDGTTVQLNMKNYFTDNGAGLYVTKPVENKVPETPVIDKVPVVETSEEKVEDEHMEIQNSEDPAVEESTVEVPKTETAQKTTSKKNRKKTSTQKEEANEQPVEAVPSVEESAEEIQNVTDSN